MRLRTHFNTEFFYLLFGCHTVDFGPLFRGEASLFNDVNHIYLLRPEGHWEIYNKVGFLKSGQAPSQV